MMDAIKKPYVLKPAWNADPVDAETLARLRAFWDYQLSSQGEVFRAMQAEMAGKHGRTHDESGIDGDR